MVTVKSRDQWTSDPFRAAVRGSKLYGRGSCNMKGAIAAMVFAAEAPVSLGLRLAGDPTICTVTDDETPGAGQCAHEHPRPGTDRAYRSAGGARV